MAKITKEQQAEAARKKQAALKTDLNIVFNGGEGIRVLKYIHALCGYDKNDLFISPKTGEVDVNGTIYNTARRSVYMDIRRYVRPEILQKVEY